MKTFKKSTPKQIEEIKVLFKLKQKNPKNPKLSYSAIGREVGIDRSTVYYWASKNFKKEVKKLKEIRIFKKKIKKIIEKKIVKEKKQPIKIDYTICKVCGTKKPKQWRLTRYCSVYCWDSYNKQPVRLYGRA